jgi:hypothetical protein
MLVMPMAVFGCAAIHQTPTFVDAPNGIAYRLGEYNDILAVTVSAVDSDKVLWKVKCNSRYALGSTKFDAFDYGKVPVNMDEVVAPAELKAGDKVVVDIHYQYDRLCGACGSTIREEFEVVQPNKFRWIKRDWAAPIAR